MVKSELNTTEPYPVSESSPVGTSIATFLFGNEFTFFTIANF